MLIYRVIMAIALPVVLLVLLAKNRAHLAERLGFGPRPPAGKTLWLHGASNGELTSARMVLQQVLNAAPDVQILVTCNTRTARAMVQLWHLPRLTVALAPLDTGGAAARLLRRWRPKALVIIENELWPARIAAAHAQDIPVLVIGARMSERSARRWHRLRGLMAQTLQKVTWLSAQDDASRARLVALGLRAVAVGPVISLKSYHPVIAGPPPFTAPALVNRTILAASTHPGDDALILDAFIAARTANRFDHLILAPRHPRRADEIAALITARGLSFATRSKGQIPDDNTPVFLADTLGEMGSWYAMASVTIIGGSFSDKGGHTPWEPASHGSAIIHGPDVANFAAPFAALDATGGAMKVRDGADLARALIGLDDKKTVVMVAVARSVLAPKDLPDEVVDRILSCLHEPKIGFVK